MIFVLDLYAFYLVDIVSLSHNAALSVILSLLYLVINVIVIYFAIKSTKDDPTDKTIYAERAARTREYQLNFNFL